MLNDFFSTVFTREDEKDTPVLNPVSDAKVVDIDVSVDIIRKKLSNLNDDKAAGNDNLSPRLLKAVADEIAYPVATIFRKSLDSGAVPRDWKTANVTPLFKQEAQLMLTTGSTRSAVSRGQQTWYHSTCYI